MPTHLRHALRDLTDDVEHRPPTPTGSHALWAAGTRRRRGRTLTRVLVGLAVVPLVAFALPWSTPSLDRVDPASDGSAGAVPDHVWSPGPWADGTEGSPPGRLALLATAERGTWWLGRRESLFGVTASGQRYVWLDLPGQSVADGPEVTLSPDGRRVGYWLAGTPRLPGAQSDVVGFAAYDTVTGEVRTRRVGTDRGLAPQALAWSPDSSRLVAHYGQYLRMLGGSAFGEVVSWDPGEDTITPIRGMERGHGLAPGLGGVVTPKLDGAIVGDPFSGATQRLRLGPGDDPAPRGVADSMLANPAGTRVAMRGDLKLGGGLSTIGLWVTELDGDRLVDARLLDRRWQVNRVLGWLDDDRVLAEGHRRGGYGVRYVAYDVRTRRAEPVIGHTAPPNGLLQAIFAHDLLRRPLAPGRAPDSPAAPHWWLLGAVGLLGAAAGVRGWSHRRPAGVG